MSKYTLLLYSKNKKSVTHCLNFFKNNTSQNFRILSKQLKITQFSVLKSPHINKKAQEQFQYVYFRTSLSFITNKIKKKQFLLKRIKNQLFPDLQILIIGTHLKTSFSRKLSFPNTVDTYNKKNLLEKSVFHLKILDYYGKQT